MNKEVHHLNTFLSFVITGLVAGILYAAVWAPAVESFGWSNDHTALALQAVGIPLGFLTRLTAEFLKNVLESVWLAVLANNGAFFVGAMMSFVILEGSFEPRMFMVLVALLVVWSLLVGQFLAYLVYCYAWKRGGHSKHECRNPHQETDY